MNDRVMLKMSFIELYVEFKQSEADRHIKWEDYNNDSKEKFESNYEVIDPIRYEDQADDTMGADVADMTNALANQHPFEEPSFMPALDLESIHAPKFFEYNAAEFSVVVDGEFVVGMEFSYREVVIMAMKDYTIHRSVDYQDHSKLDSNTITEEIKPLVEVDPFINVKSVIVKVQLKFNYTISSRKVWLAKQKSVKNFFGGWEAKYEALPIWFETMYHKEPSATIHFEIMPTYRVVHEIGSTRFAQIDGQVYRVVQVIPQVSKGRSHRYCWLSKQWLSYRS
ncbi:hypothetical protein AHAS_Ahas07G0163700 [Arachis hypogaea]